jgi:hypothetical protein
MVVLNEQGGLEGVISMVALAEQASGRLKSTMLRARAIVRPGK